MNGELVGHTRDVLGHHRGTNRSSPVADTEVVKAQDFRLWTAFLNWDCRPLQQSKPPLNFQRSHFRLSPSLLQRPTLTIFVSTKSSRCLRRYGSHPQAPSRAFDTVLTTDWRTGCHRRIVLAPKPGHPSCRDLIPHRRGPPTPVSLDTFSRANADLPPHTEKEQWPQQEGPRPREAHPLLQLLSMHPQGQGHQEIHHPQHGRVCCYSYVKTARPRLAPLRLAPNRNPARRPAC